MISAFSVPLHSVLFKNRNILFKLRLYYIEMYYIHEPFIMHADQRADSCQPRQVDVIFHDHHISDFVLWVEATTGVSHYEGLDAQFVHYTDRERDLFVDKKKITHSALN